MLTLILLRHAKAERPAPGLDDFDRELKERGLLAAQAIGRYLAGEGLIPARVLCSPAARTRQTWKMVGRELESPPKAEFDRRIYDFGDGTSLLDLIRGQAGSVSPLMLVGHNPSTEELALRLAAPGGALRRQMQAKYPTAGLTILQFAVAGWRDIAPGCGELLAFVRPADLIGGADD